MGQHRIGRFDTHKKISGSGSSALKYDVLTALLVTAAQSATLESRLSLRLSLLITARFNWRTGSFAVGLREMARMWGVTERTAKREVAAMRSLGWIAVQVPAARGRVAQYRLDFPKILQSTMPHWDAVGPDFAARMTNTPEASAEESNVVPLRQSDIPVPEQDGTGWPAAAHQLLAQDPAIYNAWFAHLKAVDQEAGILTLLAPTQFVADYLRMHHQTRLLKAVVTQDRSVREISIITA